MALLEVAVFTYLPRPKPDVLIVCDTRTLNDAHRDAESSPEPGHQSVLANWIWGREVWGHQWRNVARVALFEFGQDVNTKARAAVKRELRDLLVKTQPKRIVVLQSRSKSAKKVYDDNYAQGKHTGTIAWDFFQPPAPIRDMAGTLWDTPYGLVMPMLNSQNVDYVYGDCIYNWLTWTKDLREPVQPPPEATAGLHIRAELVGLLEAAKAGKPITFDLETFNTQDLITCVGLSDGERAVSVPWEPFTPYGQSYLEPGLHLTDKGDLVREIFRTARVVAGHNILRFDLPYLARKGIPVPGRPFDTYLAHGVTLNQFRHGLQACVAQEMPVAPWKTLHRASAAKSGLDPDKHAEAWIQEPRELRSYNLRDVFFNALLVPIYAQRVGVVL